jgi:hypothetical protein
MGGDSDGGEKGFMEWKYAQFYGVDHHKFVKYLFVCFSLFYPIHLQSSVKIRNKVREREERKRRRGHDYL